MFCRKLLLGVIFLTTPMGCGNRQGKVVATPAPQITPTLPQTLMVVPPLPSTAPAAPLPATTQAVSTFRGTGIQFDYPADWVPDKALTACFARCAPKSAGPGYSSLSLDIPKLPWHLPGMISCGMVASGYVSDLKKHQIPDAVVKEQCPVTVAGCTGQRITSQGHENGNPSIDVAVVLIHADQVYILSADSDQTGCETARKTLDAATASLKWTK